MTLLGLHNPFDAPVYYIETVSSTMDVSRNLAGAGEPHGTVITAGFQEAGRGRGCGRVWEMERGLNLPFTVLLRFPSVEAIPAALTLRTGLAVSLAVEEFAPSLSSRVFVKWPNDILIDSKKLAGIICEADGGNVHIGIGVNFAQKEFPVHLQEKAVSVVLASGCSFSQDDRYVLLEKILIQLHSELAEVQDDSNFWKACLEKRLYKNGEQVVFIEGAAGSGKEIKGHLAGVGSCGELLIVPDGETTARSYVTGELKI